ncbi:hypothetical protein [Pseudoruegeria sp. HB172150]|uniref:hypothetical protein n=1 Tax=Pseudoruegeria sp. HB172150 TaxID=2721164 RepID=UPI0020A61EE1|nr:hypothetical protein [Pseudoruegeria sp. HB172150]
MTKGLNRVLAGTTAFLAAHAATAAPGDFAKENYTTPLADVCPSPFYIQKDWLAQAEHGGLYQMIGGGGTMESGRYTGPLGATGIDLVILEGGGNIGLGDGETAYSALFNGNSKAGVVPHLGFQELDNAFIFSKMFPVVGVFVPLDIAPSGLIWDEGTYPDGFHSVEDLKAFGESGGGMIYVSTITRTFGLYLVNSGVPKEAFIEGYRGDLENFVTHNGEWLNQGFVTTEVYNLSHGLNWEKPVDAVTVNELGYPTITGMVSVAAPRMEELAPCLEKMVPIMQQAAVDYMNDPAEVNQLIYEFNEGGYGTSWWKTSMELNEFSANAQKERGIVGNGTNDTIGDFDMERVEEMFGIVKPWLDERSNPDVVPDDVVTNRFIDPTIGLE